MTIKMMVSRLLVESGYDIRGLERWKHRAGHMREQAEGAERQATGWH